MNWKNRFISEKTKMSEKMMLMFMFKRQEEENKGESLVIEAIDKKFKDDQAVKLDKLLVFARQMAILTDVDEFSVSTIHELIKDYDVSESHTGKADLSLIFYYLQRN
jgi:hypothetical protein